MHVTHMRGYNIDINWRF